MPTIYDLPLETVEYIIKSAYPSAPPTREARRERIQFLLAVALVCHAWTPSAQQGLWLDVYLGPYTISHFDAAGPGRYPVHRLDLQLYSAANHLKSLSLYYTVLTTGPVTLTLPFNLSILEIVSANDPPESSFESLDALSRQSSITSLAVSANGFSPSLLIERLAPLAPRLVTLKVTSHHNYPGSRDEFLQLCTRLKHLESESRVIGSIHDVVVPLASWTVLHPVFSNIATILDAVESDCVAVSQLERLALKSDVRFVTLRGAPRWTELEQRCREKKIKLVTGDPMD